MPRVFGTVAQIRLRPPPYGSGVLVQRPPPIPLSDPARHAAYHRSCGSLGPRRALTVLFRLPGSEPARLTRRPHPGSDDSFQIRQGSGLRLSRSLERVVLDLKDRVRSVLGHGQSLNLNGLGTSTYST